MHPNEEANKDIMTDIIHNQVEQLESLFPRLTLLIAWPAGSKGERKAWKHLDPAVMRDSDHRQRLSTGNIGVALGRRSGGLATIDIDDDGQAEEFLALNPALVDSLRTRGQRGCNVWLYPGAPVPRSATIRRQGRPWGEWRYEGCQTILAGRHPCGEPYKVLRAGPPATLPFINLIFPSGAEAPFLPECVVTERHRVAQGVVLCSTQSDSVHSVHSVTAIDEGWRKTIEAVLPGTLATAPHTSHERLFKLARRVRGLEVVRECPLTDEQLVSLFGAWHRGSLACLRPSQSYDEYLYEFRQACACVQVPDGQGVIDDAWHAIEDTQAPAETELVSDPRLQRLIVLCHVLQGLAGDRPFYLACRTVQQLFGLGDHRQAARWLRVLCSCGILQVVVAGNVSTLRATRYRYHSVAEEK